MSSRDSDVQFEQDSDDDFDWEEVEVPEHPVERVHDYGDEHEHELEEEQQEEEEKHFEITIQSGLSKKKDSSTPKNRGISHAERQHRITCHKIHTIALLANAAGRNKWINDELLHARLLSLTPMHLQNSFSLIHKSRIPDPNQRGRMFEQAILNLVTWWSEEFFEVTLSGHLRSRTFEAVQSRLDALYAKNPGVGKDTPMAPKDIWKVLELKQDDIEIIKSPNSLMKHLLMQLGSRDVSAQLFTGLCRALGIGARLVVSLQSVPWQVGVGRGKPVYRKSKGKVKAGEKEGGEEEDGEQEVAEVEIDVKGKGKAKASTPTFPGSGNRLSSPSPLGQSAKSKGKQKASASEPVVKLWKQKDRGRVLGAPTPTPSASSSTPNSSRFASPLPSKTTDPTTPPVFWTEVFSRPDGRWIPVDPIRGIVNKRKIFDPTPLPVHTNSNSTNLVNTGQSTLMPSRPGTPRTTAGGGGKKGEVQDNRMVYVMAFEEDGYARDVTRRYAREYSSKILKAQGQGVRGQQGQQGREGAGVLGGGGKGRVEWWERVVESMRRPYRLNRDDVEDEELEMAVYREPMPTTLAGFKDHPLYILPRHLLLAQIIHPAPPLTPSLGNFRGEPVYPRSSVLNLKTAENWMRSEGRQVKEGEQGLKMTKVRAGTVGRMREREGLRVAGGASSFPSSFPSSSTTGEGGEPGEAGQASTVPMQPLYALHQTTLYIPPPIINGHIPKNSFGNVDLYVPSMLPEGGVHVPFKGVARVARRLGIEFGEAVTGFEFKKRRAYPVIEGVVVAKENEALLVEAYLEAEEAAARKAQKKREERTIKLWAKLVTGLRIRARLQEQYASRTPASARNTTTAAGDAADSGGEEGGEGEEGKGGGGGGGFMNEGRGEKIKEIAILGMSRSAQGPSAYSGGGFLAADDVIQPYHLPKGKFQHESSQTQSPSHSSQAQSLPGKQPGQELDLEVEVEFGAEQPQDELEFQEHTPTLEPGLEPEEGEKEAVRRAGVETDELLHRRGVVGGNGGGRGRTVFDPMQLDEKAAGVEEEDEEMEEVDVALPGPGPSTLNGMNGNGNEFVPKSMQELAEDEAKRREEEGGMEGEVVEELGVASARNGGGFVPKPQPILKTNGKKPSARNTRASTRASGTSTPTIVITPAKAGKANGRAAKMNGKANGKAKATPTRRQSTRKPAAKKRKRDEEEEEEEEEGESSALSDVDDDYAVAGGDKEGEDDLDAEEVEERQQEEPSPSPSKRPRRSTRKELNYKEADVPVGEVKTNGRTLRPRKSRG